MDGDRLPEPRRKWLVFGIAAAAINYVFLLLVLVLLSIDSFLAILVVFALSIVGGIVAMYFVLYVY